MNIRFILFFMMLCTNIIAQQPLLQSPSKGVSPSRWRTRSHFSTQVAVLDRIADEIDQVPAGGYVGVDDPWLSNRRILKALIDARKRGVTVDINTSSRVKGDMKKLGDAGVAVHQVNGLHTKRFIAAETMPTAVAPATNWVYVGSHNASQLAQHHQETMSETRNDGDFFMQHLQDHRTTSVQTSPVKAVSKRILHTTPVKRAATSSQEYDSNAAKRLRLETLAKSKHPDDCADITSMTFDSDEIVKAVEKIKRERKENPARIRLFVDSSALAHKDLLNRMIDAGVAVYVFNPDKSQKIFNKFPTLQHTKTIIRQCGGECLAVVSTGNLTANSAREINVDSYHPCDRKMFDEIRQFNDELAGQSQVYSK